MLLRGRHSLQFTLNALVQKNENGSNADKYEHVTKTAEAQLTQMAYFKFSQFAKKVVLGQVTIRSRLFAAKEDFAVDASVVLQ